MEKAKKTLPSREENAAVEQPKQPNHTEKIKSQVFLLCIVLERFQVFW